MHNDTNLEVRENTDIEKDTSGSENIFKIEEIGTNTYRIEECGFVNAYLLVGSEKALLIDTGNGAGNISKEVASLTKLPLEVVITHRHCDHIGGAGWFGKVYVHKEDKALIYNALASQAASKSLAVYNKMDCVFEKKPYHVKMVAIRDDWVFDLGNRDVRVRHLPGHTRGSIILTDEKNHLMFVGDNYGKHLKMHIPGAVTMEEWFESIDELVEISEDYRIFGGHSDGYISRGDLLSCQLLGSRILQQGENTGFISIKTLKDEERDISITYNTEHVFKKLRKFHAELAFSDNE